MHVHHLKGVVCPRHVGAKAGVGSWWNYLVQVGLGCESFCGHAKMRSSAVRQRSTLVLSATFAKSNSCKCDGCRQAGVSGTDRHSAGVPHHGLSTCRQDPHACCLLVQARVYSPSRTAGQQGLGNTFNNKNGRPWKIVFDTQEK